MWLKMYLEIARTSANTAYKLRPSGFATFCLRYRYGKKSYMLETLCEMPQIKPKIPLFISRSNGDLTETKRDYPR